MNETTKIWTSLNLQHQLHILKQVDLVLFTPKPGFDDLVKIFEYAIANPSEEQLKVVAKALEKYNEV